MPFEKTVNEKFYQDLNNHKKRWRAVADDVNSTPAQKSKANEWLMFLCAETDVDRNLHRLERLVTQMAKIGYRTTEDDRLEPEEGSINDMALKMLSIASSGVKDGV